MELNKHNELALFLMQAEGLNRDEADAYIAEMRRRLLEGVDADVLMAEVGLPADFLINLFVLVYP
jgi:hypothetical protein